MEYNKCSVRKFFYFEFSSSSLLSIRISMFLHQQILRLIVKNRHQHGKSLYIIFISIEIDLSLFIRNYQSLPSSPHHLVANAYLSLHHSNPFFFPHQTTFVPQHSHPTTSLDETEQSDDEDDEEEDDDDDDDDDHSSVVSIETKPNPAASLIKHSIANILSNKISVKNKRPFSSSSNCESFFSLQIMSIG